MTTSELVRWRAKKFPNGRFCNVNQFVLERPAGIQFFPARWPAGRPLDHIGRAEIGTVRTWYELRAELKLAQQQQAAASTAQISSGVSQNEQL